MMKPIYALTLASLALCAAGPAQAQHHWSYDGPAIDWANLEPEFKTCGIGAQQSPIDLTGAVPAKVTRPALAWKAETGAIVNNGHTIQVNVPGGSTLGGADSGFVLKQFHFHSPSEHAVDGARADMEVHFVHAGPNGALKVIGVLVKAGKTNKPFAELMEAASSATSATTPLRVDPARLLPGKGGVYRYEGSLTTPPCSEVVDWTVFARPIEASAADIARFKALFPMNARPLQPANRRFVLRSER